MAVTKVPEKVNEKPSLANSEGGYNLKGPDRIKESSCAKEPEKIVRHPDFSRFEKPFGFELHVFTAMFLTHGHIFALYACYLTLTGRAPVSTILFELLFAALGGIGITVGCHRYWAHKTFKANKALQVILMLFQTLAFQYPIHKWSLDHRIHHKYTDTNADPHNSKRGLLFSHVGWLYSPRHPEFQKKWDTFDVSDLERDPIVRFQSRWYWTLLIIVHMIIPIAILRYFWGLPLLYCWAINCRRYVVTLHGTWSVNSFAHKYGDKPYDRNISSVENRFVALIAIGEGFHNYHHTFPFDYKASELGWKLNPSTMFIDFFASIGWVTEMKTVSQKMLKARLQRTGEGSHELAKEPDDNKTDFDYSLPADVTELMKGLDKPVWGWEDDEIPEDFKRITKILRPNKSDSCKTKPEIPSLG